MEAAKRGPEWGNNGRRQGLRTDDPETAAASARSSWIKDRSLPTERILPPPDLCAGHNRGHARPQPLKIKLVDFGTIQR